MEKKKFGEIRPNQTYNEIVINNDWERYRDERYHEGRRLWAELHKTHTVSEFPLHLDIETTTVCNLRCPMCPRTVAVQREEFSELDRMSFDTYKNIIDQGVEHGLFSIKLNYLGEPLVHPDVINHVKYAKQKGVQDVMFNTNGVLLTPEKGLELLEAGIDKLFLSFDSPYPEQYEKIRIGAKFEKVLENWRRMYEMKREKFPHVHLRVSMVVMDENPKIREDFIDMFKDKADAIGFGELCDTENRSERPEYKGFECVQFYQRMFLRANGDVIVCCMDERSDYIVADWRKAPLKEIWHNEKYEAIRRLHREGQYYSIPMCRVCSLPVAELQAIQNITCNT